MVEKGTKKTIVVSRPGNKPSGEKVKGKVPTMKNPPPPPPKKSV